MLAELMRQDNYDKANFVNAIQQLGNSFDKQRIRKLGSAFIQHGDYTPQGLFKFAQANKLQPQELNSLAQVVKMSGALKPKKVKINYLGPNGNTYTTMMDANDPRLSGQGLLSKIAYTTVKGVDDKGNPTEGLVPTSDALSTGLHRTGTAKSPTLDQLIGRKASGSNLEQLLSIKKQLSSRGQTTGLQKKYAGYKANHPDYTGSLVDFKHLLNAPDPVRMALSLAQRDMRVVADPGSLSQVAKEYLKEISTLKTPDKAPAQSNVGEIIKSLLEGSNSK